MDNQWQDDLPSKTPSKDYSFQQEPKRKGRSQESRELPKLPPGKRSQNINMFSFSGTMSMSPSIDNHKHECQPFLLEAGLIQGMRTSLDWIDLTWWWFCSKRSLEQEHYQSHHEESPQPMWNSFQYNDLQSADGFLKSYPRKNSTLPSLRKNGASTNVSMFSSFSLVLTMRRRRKAKGTFLAPNDGSTPLKMVGA